MRQRRRGCQPVIAGQAVCRAFSCRATWPSGLPRRVCGTHRDGLVHKTGSGLGAISSFGKKLSGRPGQATAGRLVCRHLRRCLELLWRGVWLRSKAHRTFHCAGRDRWQRDAVEGAIHLKDCLNPIWLRYFPVCDNCGYRQEKEQQLPCCGTGSCRGHALPFLENSVAVEWVIEYG